MLTAAACTTVSDKNCLLYIKTMNSEAPCGCGDSLARQLRLDPSRAVR